METIEDRFCDGGFPSPQREKGTPKCQLEVPPLKL